MCVFMLRFDEVVDKILEKYGRMCRRREAACWFLAAQLA